MRFFILIVGFMCCLDAFAVSAGRINRATQNSRVASQSSRSALSSLPVYAQQANSEYANATTQNVQEETTEVDPEIAKKEKEREICKSNNIGIGNTFVWASRNSDTSSYNYMVEDVSNIKNNTCFTKVEMVSTDNRVKMSDIPSKYFEMGQSISCGSWVNEKDLEKRILEAKKTGRVLGTVAATVGGAAVGVGAMELFGNKLIGGKVEGQKSLAPKELLRSQVLALKKSNPSEYGRIINALDELETVCNDEDLWQGTNKPSDCDESTNLFLGLRDTL